MLEYKQKRNNGRTPFAGVYKFVCVWGCVRVHVQLYMYIGLNAHAALIKSKK